MNTPQKSIYFDSVGLSGIEYCSYLDHYIFSDPISGVNIFYPLTAFGGPLSAGSGIPPETGGVTFNGSISGGPLEDTCFQDYCFRTYVVAPIKLYCSTTVNYSFSGLDQSDSRILKIIYDFGDKSEFREVPYIKTNTGSIEPQNVVVSKTYYPTNELAVTYTPSISVIRSDCCINTYRLTLSSFRCGILDIYEDVVLHNAQQASGFDIILTMEKVNQRQLFKNALDINDITFAIPALSTLPYLVEPVPPQINKPKPEPIGPKKPVQPIDQNPVTAPEPGYYYVEGEGVDLVPDFLRIVPSEDITSNFTSGLSISGDGPPYIQGEGIDIRFS